MEERIRLIEEDNRKLHDKVDYLEFRTELLADLSEENRVNSILLDYKITRKEYLAIMDVMDHYRIAIDSGKEVSSAKFEAEIQSIFPERQSERPVVEYHFCEAIAQAFMEARRWEEVFPALYGDLPKYRFYMENRKKER